MARGAYLTKTAQYALVYRGGSSWVDRLVVMKVLPNSLDLTRCGFSVSRRVGSAVVRNRVKRRLREIMRLTPLPPGWDIVLIARPRVATARYDNIEKSVKGLLARAGLLTEKYEKTGLKTN